MPDKRKKETLEISADTPISLLPIPQVENSQQPDQAAAMTPPKKRSTNPFLRFRVRKKNPEGYKSAALIDEKLIDIEGVDKKEIASVISQEFSKEESNRPVVEFGPPTPTHGRPLYVTTPKKTRLDREKDYGPECIMIYSNLKKKEVVRVLPEKIPEEVSQILQDHNGSKFQEVVVTPELVEKMRKGQPKRGTNGIKNQNSVMAREGVNPKEASATKIAEKLGLLTPIEGTEDNLPRYEWCHTGQTYALWGLLAQMVRNLTGGSEYANTDMIFAEDSVINIVEALGERIFVQVDPIEKGTHFAQEIHYTVITSKFKIRYVFNNLTSIQPGKVSGSYINAVVDTLVDFAKPKEKSKQVSRSLDFITVKKPASKPMPLLFFTSTTSSATNTENSEKNENTPINQEESVVKH